LSKKLPEETKKEQALAYCGWLSQKSLPDYVEKIMSFQKRKGERLFLKCLSHPEDALPLSATASSQHLPHQSQTLLSL